MFYPGDENRLNLTIKQGTDCRLVQGTMAQAQIRHKRATAERKARQGNEALTTANKSKRTVLCPLLDLSAINTI